MTANDATRVFGAETAEDMATRLAPGPVLALLVDAPYDALEKVSHTHVYLKLCYAHRIPWWDVRIELF